MIHSCKGDYWQPQPVGRPNMKRYTKQTQVMAVTSQEYIQSIDHI